MFPMPSTLMSFCHVLTSIRWCIGGVADERIADETNTSVHGAIPTKYS